MLSVGVSRSCGKSAKSVPMTPMPTTRYTMTFALYGATISSFSFAIFDLQK